MSDKFKPNLDPDDRVIRIAQAENGQGMRHLTGTKTVSSASMVLRKAGGGCFVEAGVELMIAKHLEFTTSVVKLKSQPCRFELILKGALRTYTPDFAVLHDDGRREILEIKADWAHLDDPEYVHMLDLVQAALHARGWTFRTVVKAHFLPECGPLKREKRIVDDNINLMYASSMTFVTKSQKARVGGALRDGGGVTTLAAVCHAIGGYESAARARAYSMAAQRLIEIDLTRPLSHTNQVRSVKALPAHLAALRF